MEVVYLALGSNLGDREAYIRKAIDLLDKSDYLWVKKVATFIETDPVSKSFQSRNPITKQAQQRFINTVIKCETILSAEELLALTQRIETELGRTHKGLNQPRTIDIDILLYGEDVVCTEALTIPHPLLHERFFVLIPLKELAPDLVHPVLQERISDVYARVVGY